jgi:hypothetical protein
VLRALIVLAVRISSTRELLDNPWSAGAFKLS